MSAAGMTHDQVNDFPALEDRIVALLQAEFEHDRPAVHVLTRSDLEGVKESMQLAPAVHVISSGFRPVEQQYKIARLAHRFFVVGVARSAARQSSQYAARQAAGRVAVRAIRALMSESLPGAEGPMQMTSAPAGAAQNGFYYLPTAWEVITIFRKT